MFGYHPHTRSAVSVQKFLFFFVFNKSSPFLVVEGRPRPRLTLVPRKTTCATRKYLIDSWHHLLDKLFWSYFITGFTEFEAKFHTARVNGSSRNMRKHLGWGSLEYRLTLRDSPEATGDHHPTRPKNTSFVAPSGREKFSQTTFQTDHVLIFIRSCYI